MGITISRNAEAGGSAAESRNCRASDRRSPRGVFVSCLALAACGAPQAALAQYGAPSVSTALEANTSSGAANRTGPPFQFRISGQETFTDNVNLEPSSTRQSDLITQLTPAVSMYYHGGRTQLTGDISLPILLYAHTGSRNNRVVPQANVTGRLEAVERLFFIEAAVNASQSYLSPLGATSTAIENNPGNAYSQQSYRISPYLRHEAGDYAYQIRNDSTWSNASDTPTNVSNVYSNALDAYVTRTPRPFGWAAQYHRDDVRFTDRQSESTEIARLRGTWRPVPEWQLSAHGGYERADFVLAEQSGIVYGAGLAWQPDVRTRLSATWEHRFFGTAYQFDLHSRTPLVTWSITSSRDVSSYPQLLAQLGAGDVTSILDQLFSSRFPDPAERHQFVENVIRDRGLPATLTDPIGLYTQNIVIEENTEATVGLIGARNTVLFRAYHLRTVAAPGSDVLEANLVRASDVTQDGGGVTWTHSLTPLAHFVLRYDQRYAAQTSGPGSARSRSLTGELSYALTHTTSLRAGARAQRQRSDTFPGYDEAAVYVGFTHLFH
jgi:uncharacterized protein (PEP-CTERM system associated)